MGRVGLFPPYPPDQPRPPLTPARVPHMDFLTALRSGSPVFAAELRPPRAELASAEGMDAWIDTYHAVRRLTREGTYVFLTDSAVGAAEEDNLRHLVTNLQRDVPRERIVPFMTSKHPMEDRLVRGTRAAERLSRAGGPRRRQGRGVATLRRARLATAPDPPLSTTTPWRSVDGPTRTRTPRSR